MTSQLLFLQLTLHLDLLILILSQDSTLTLHDLLAMDTSRSGSRKVTGQSASLWNHGRAHLAKASSNGGTAQQSRLAKQISETRLHLL